MSAVRIDILRPMDTDRMGWSQTLRCGPCGCSIVWKPPADMRRLNWAYVVQIAECPRCYTPALSFGFSGPMIPASGIREAMGELRREP